METLEKSAENKKEMKLKIINKHKELVAKNQYDIARRILRFMVAKRETLGIGNSDWRLANILEEQNDIISAQKIILNELNTEFGGHAKLMVDAVDQSKNSWQTFKEVLGERLQPTVDALFTGFSGLLRITTEVFKQTEVEKVTEDIEEQRIRTYALSDAYLELKDKANKSTAEQEYYTEVIAELQKMYPDYLKNMDLQNIKMGEAKKLMAELNQEMETKFLNMKAEAATTDLYNKLADKIVEEKVYLNEIKKGEARIKAFEQTDAYKQGQTLSNDSLVNYNLAKSYLPKVREEIAKTKAEIKETTDFYKELIKTDEQTKKKIYYKTPDGVYNNYDPSDEPTSITTVGTGEKDKTKYSLDTSERIETKKKKLDAELAEEQKNADKWEKQINVIENEKADAEIDAQTKYDNKIKSYEAELAKNNTAENKKRLDAKVTEAQKELATSIAVITSTSNDKIKAIQDAKQAEADAEKKADEKYEQDKEARIAERDRAREQQRERTEQYRENTPEKKLERGEAYAYQVVGLTDPSSYGVRDKEIEDLTTFNDLKKKLFEDELTYTEIHKSKLSDLAKKELSEQKASHSLQKSLEEDKKNFKNMLSNTGESLTQKLISGEVKSGKQMKALMKENLKAYLVDSGQRHAHKALEEGAEAISRLAAQDYPGATAHGLAAAEHVAVATAAGVAANSIKTPSSSDSKDSNNNLPGNSVSTTKTKELVINTDNQAVIRMLMPELAQALDDGYSISKK